ncbi:ATP-binding protein [Listeria ivanovii]|uniref:ATP-binding protein n=1 Tax=Listeria ivanovii TaxID=1638 RepID=UPI0016236263|nr:ATP-binding protein [Listeria ivanovii]MBC1758734.1 ATP-binding protein [Listeria ivanovii]
MKNVFASAIDSACENDNRKKGDYTNAEGVLMCGKCHTAKQTMVEIPELEIPPRLVSCLCKCEGEKLERQRVAEMRKQALERVEAMRRKGLLENQYTSSTFADDDRTDAKASEVCRKYVEQWKTLEAKNIGLMLYGDVGGGKTFLAACIANALIDQGVEVMMTTIPRLANAMSKDYGNERKSVLQRIANVPLLVLDDVGTERNTSYGYELMYDIINTRYKAKKPLIITTNLTMNALKQAEDTNQKRIYDRLVEMCAPVKVSSSGRRQKLAKTKYEEMKQLGIL